MKRTTNDTLVPRSLLARVLRAGGAELEVLHPIVLLADAMARLVPNYVADRLRTRILRLAGWRIGRGTFFAGVPRFSGVGAIRSRLTIGASGWINVGCTFDLNDTITIGDGVLIGHEVMVLTSTHKIGSGARRAGETITKPVVISDGVWLGAKCVILPGVTLGAGCVIGAGAVVTKDVPSDAVAVGVPARVVRMLDP